MHGTDAGLPSSIDARLEGAIARAAAALGAAQRKDGHWVFELEADATIPAEYILLRHYLGEPEDLDLEERIARYLRRITLPGGGWSLFHDGKFDISASIKAYYALKMVGEDIDAPEAVILHRKGGIVGHRWRAAARGRCCCGVSVVFDAEMTIMGMQRGGEGSG